MGTFVLNNKIALITGGSRGIGKAIALGFSEAGAKVIVAARTQNLLEEVLAEMRAKGGDGLAVLCDLKNDQDILSLIKKTVDRYGRLDVLVNNAATSPFLKKSEEVTSEEWEQVIRINLTAPFLLCREASKVMIQNNWGRIINIASVGGLIALPRLVAYCAAKGGLIQLTKVLAVEWAAKYNITVNAIAPGYISTDLTEGMRASEQISKNLLQRTPMRRFGEPNEVVGAALYLASESSTYSTGAVITVDGGWMAS